MLSDNIVRYIKQLLGEMASCLKNWAKLPLTKNFYAV